ncbi:MAG: GIY-YIG nuclease family protein [Candidatus Omnitrophota bacterium]
MYYVYVLQSVNNEYIYVGSTRDLKRRIQEHNHGKSHSTKKYVPLVDIL